MVFDRTENEPEEWDPEEDLRDPDSDSLTIPRVSTEDAGSDLRSDLQSELGSTPEHESSTDEIDVSADLLKAFWSIVFVINAAVLVASLGILFLIFNGATTRSLGLIAGGTVLFAFAGWRYKTYRAADRREEATKSETKPTDDHAQSPSNETHSDDQSENRSPDDSD